MNRLYAVSCTKNQNLDGLKDLNNAKQKHSGWFNANKMALKIKKITFTSFSHWSSKKMTCWKWKWYNSNEMGPDPGLIHRIERIHSNHTNPPLRACKFLH